jgi:hypothetical protein
MATIDKTNKRQQATTRHQDNKSKQQQNNKEITRHYDGLLRE